MSVSEALHCVVVHILTSRLASLRFAWRRYHTMMPMFAVQMRMLGENKFFQKLTRDMARGRFPTPIVNHYYSNFGSFRTNLQRVNIAVGEELEKMNYPMGADGSLPETFWDRKGDLNALVRRALLPKDGKNVVQNENGLMIEVCKKCRLAKI